MELTSSNYYSNESTHEYMHATTFKRFLFDGEDLALARYKGLYTPQESVTPLLVGNYVHSYFESPEAHQRFVDEHPEIVSSRGASKGQLKTEYKQADDMIKRIEADQAIMTLINAAPEKEMIVTGSIVGMNWAGKLDAVSVERGYFIDFKTVATLKPIHGGLVGAEWSDYYGSYENFFKARGYDLQMAAYQLMLSEKYGKHFDVYIVAVSKDAHPIAQVFKVSTETLRDGMNLIELNTPHVKGLIDGTIEPRKGEIYNAFYRDNYRVDPHELEEL